MEKSLLGTVGRPRTSCLKCIADKKKCLPLLQPGGKYSSCQRCHAKLILCSFGEMNSEINSEKNVEVSSKAPKEEELSKKPRYIYCLTAQPSVLTVKRRRIMESCNGVGEADVTGRATHLPSFSLGCVDELNHEEADRCGRATPLPSQFHSAEDAFNVCDESEDVDAEGSGRAIPLPPDSFSLKHFCDISQHPKFKSLFHVASTCKGSRKLFEYDMGSSIVIPYKLSNRLRYTSYSNPVYIECTTFPSHSFKDNCLNCFVCFSTSTMASFKLGIIEGIHYNIMMSPDHIVDGVLQVRECEYNLFHNKRSSNATVHKFILGQDDCHFSMFFVNKVMGPPLTSDKEDVVNEADQCIQHSASGKECNH